MDLTKARLEIIIEIFNDTLARPYSNLHFWKSTKIFILQYH
jgi:hypothetical protein